MDSERDTRIFKKITSIITTQDKTSYIGQDDVVSLVKDGISISFHLKNSELDIVNIFRTVKRTQKLVKVRFDIDVEQITINIYDSNEELRQNVYAPSRYGSWIAGIYDGEIRIISERNADELDALYIIITHEIIHLAIRRLSGGQCPYWLDEGLAVYLSQELPQHYQLVICAAARNDTMLPLESLEKPPGVKLKEEARVLAYAESAFMVNYLCENYDWEKIKAAVRKSRNKNKEQILAEMGLNYYLLELACKRWILTDWYKDLSKIV